MSRHLSLLKIKFNYSPLDTYRDAVFLDFSTGGSLTATTLSCGDASAFLNGPKRTRVKVLHGLLRGEVQWVLP